VTNSAEARIDLAQVRSPTCSCHDRLTLVVGLRITVIDPGQKVRSANQ
jgi:hypothetical protein